VEGTSVLRIKEESALAGASLRTNRSYRFRQIGLAEDLPREASASPTILSDGTEQRLALVGEHGDFSLAYTTAVQPGLKYFGDQRGYIAYDERLGYTFVLGDPVAAPRDRAGLIEQFVAEHRHVAFCQISHATALLLRECKFLINEMGVDSILSLPDYDFCGQDKKWLRTAEAWTSRRGYTTREESTASVGVEEVESVSLAWRATRTVKKKEVRFLNRPFTTSEESGTRRFYFFDPDKRMLAFVYFDPLFRDGRHIRRAGLCRAGHHEIRNRSLSRRRLSGIATRTKSLGRD
jgi:lysylphosphatidylglycerol synthetase-like protein (DUF2156 family)